MSKAKLILAETYPEVIFIDNHLPDGLGFDYIPDLHKIFPLVKIIAMSSDNSCKNKDKAINNGANHFLEKPFLVNELNKLLDEICLT